MSNFERRASNECNCGHLLGAHDYIEATDKLPCTKCKTCGNYGRFRHGSS